MGELVKRFKRMLWSLWVGTPLFPTVHQKCCMLWYICSLPFWCSFPVPCWTTCLQAWRQCREFHVLQSVVEGCVSADAPVLQKFPQAHSKHMACMWQAHGMHMAGTWQNLPGTCPTHGMHMAGTWQNLPGTWQAHSTTSRHMATPAGHMAST